MDEKARSIKVWPFLPLCGYSTVKAGYWLCRGRNGRMFVFPGSKDGFERRIDYLGDVPTLAPLEDWIVECISLVTGMPMNGHIVTKDAFRERSNYYQTKNLQEQSSIFKQVHDHDMAIEALKNEIRFKKDAQ